LQGTQKNIEDDPSITPGSVARNPLSISSAKESELFGSTAKTSPNEILSSSTWSYPSTTQQNFNSTMSKLGADTKTNSWSDSASDLWAAPTTLGKTSGPPPGLGASKNGSTSVASSESANDWMSWNPSGNTGSGAGNNANGTWYSTWLLLKNLTAQIDGSTLRTLCVQHGPLQHFHLYLNHGIALCKYSSREEASKAQQALNNCVLSNTTICAESPSESEVQNILSHLGVPASGNGNGGNGNGNGGNSSAVGAGPNASTWRPNSQQGRAGDSAWGTSDWPASNSGESELQSNEFKHFQHLN
jgi:trinucleotide repeat-containing gene 6 protein